MTEPVSGFFAFPSNPPILVETVTTAITHLNNGGVAKLKPWSDCKIGGKVVISVILDEISKNSLFCADLTGFNPNVLFELGFAIAKQKRIWPVADFSDANAHREFNSFGLLKDVGYSSYENSHDLCKDFYEQDISGDQAYSLFDTLVLPHLYIRQPRALLYLKSPQNNEASLKLTEALISSGLDFFQDDPKETQSPTLAWFIKSIFNSSATIAHLVPQHKEGAALHNSKCAFISGLALGLGKDVLMMAESAYSAPLDYNTLLYCYSTAAECEQKVLEFLVQQVVDREENTKEAREERNHQKALSFLQSLHFGEDQAENENAELPSYFIETYVFHRAQRERLMLIVGRKGTGKTANLLALGSSLREKSQSNFVCEVRPVDYELEGVLSLVTSLEKVERGFLLESLWKFLLYTELAYSVRNELSAKPIHYVYTQAEADLIHLCDVHSNIMGSSFTVRLESAIADLASVSREGSITDRRVRVSEALHKGILGKIRTLLGEILFYKDRVVFLVDNLDKAWNKRSDLQALAHFLHALLKVQPAIVADFESRDAFKKPVKVSLLVFLRSDIYSFILSVASEPDKVPVERIRWEDPEILMTVLEQRFAAIRGGGGKVSDLWTKVFVERVGTARTKAYIANIIIPRPRDLVFFANAALQEAVNRRHRQIEETDLIAAAKSYSLHAFKSLLAEGAGEFDLEAILYHFVGKDAILKTSEIVDIGNQALVSANFDSVLTELLDLTVLGYEVGAGEFKFLYDEYEKKKFEILARNYATARSQEQRYKLHPALWGFLEIPEPSVELELGAL